MNCNYVYIASVCSFRYESLPIVTIRVCYTHYFSVAGRLQLTRSYR